MTSYDSKTQNPIWLEKEAKRVLLTESAPGGSGYANALKLLPIATQRLVQEATGRNETGTPEQGRRGSPASDINVLYPTVLHLILNGLSSTEAWDLLHEHIPRRDYMNAKRQLNRARSELEKAAHEAASAVVGGKPRAFNKAYVKLLNLSE